MNRRLLSAAAVGLLASAAIAVLAWRARHAGPPRPVAVFWERFRQTNTAWLNPQPPAGRLEIAIDARTDDGQDGLPQWTQTARLRTWCTPDRNVRFVHEEWRPPTNRVRTDEARYFHGRGGRVTLPSHAAVADLNLENWLAARIGCGFLTGLHLLEQTGLPRSASLESTPDGALRLRVTGLGDPRQHPGWARLRSNLAGYGLHPAAFASVHVVAPETVEVRIDPVTLRPQSLREWDREGRLSATLEFDPAWLSLSNGPAPHRVRCELPHGPYRLEFAFAADHGQWRLDTFAQDTTGAASLARRARLELCRWEPIPDAEFPHPADHALPAHSFTTLGPGDRLVRFRTDDGLELEGKLTLPVAQPAPVVLFLPGAGPWTFDRPLVHPDLDRVDEGPLAPKRVTRYSDFFARELASRGLGFFRCNKRGCAIVEDDEGFPREASNRSIFSQATPAVLLADYRCALRALRTQPGVDSDRILLLGASEGTRLAPRLARLEPRGILALALFGYAEDGTRDVIRWQHTVGPWRNVARLFDLDRDGRIGRAEYAAVTASNAWLAARVPFAPMDRNRDGQLTPDDLDQRQRADRIAQAVRRHEDEFLWDQVVNLTSAYLAEDWRAPPNHRTLLELDVPIGIFHGEDDGTCRVEGARAAEQAFRRAGRTNLTARTYPGADHDLNWPQFLRHGRVPPAFQDLFDYLAAGAQRPARRTPRRQVRFGGRRSRWSSGRASGANPNRV